MPIVNLLEQYMTFFEEKAGQRSQNLNVGFCNKISKFLTLL